MRNTQIHRIIRIGDDWKLIEIMKSMLKGSTKWVFSPKIIGNMLHNDPKLMLKKTMKKHDRPWNFWVPSSNQTYGNPSFIDVPILFSHSFPFSLARPSKTPVKRRPRKRLPGCRSSRGGNLCGRSDLLFTMKLTETPRRMGVAPIKTGFWSSNNNNYI